MAKSFRQFLKGILLRGETSDPVDNASGSMWHNSTSGRIKAYVEAAVRTLVSEDQTQTLTNKDIDADNNTISNIADANIKTGADIARDKLVAGTADVVLVNDGSGVLSESSVSSTDLDTLQGLAGEVLVTEDGTQTLTNKTIDADLNSISNIENADIKAGAAIDRSKLNTGTANRIVINNGSGVMADNNIITANRALISDASGLPTHSTVTDTDLATLAGLAGETLVTTDNTQTLTGKTIDGDDNTVQDLALSSLKTNLTDANKFLVRNGSGVVVSNTKDVPTGVVVGTTDTQTLTNKTLTSPNIDTPDIDGGTATNSSRIILPKETTANLDALTDVQALVAFDTSKNAPVYNDGAGWKDFGSAGIANNIIEGDSSNFEGSVGSWVAYADAAGTQPVDGTGGSPTVAVSRTTTGSEVLNGIATLKIAKDAANRQGEGASLTVDVPNFIRGLPCKIRFSAKGSANFDFGSAFDSSDPSDVTIYAYDVTNSKLLQPYPYTIMSNGIAEGMFQIPSDCASLRLILHVTTTNAAAWDLFIDDVEISPVFEENIKADSDYESQTLTVTGFGTVTTTSFKTRKNGDCLEGIAYWTCGTVTASVASIALPSGLQIDTTKLSRGATTAQNGEIVGAYGGNGTTECGYVIAATGTSNTLLYFGNSYDTATALDPANGDVVSTTGREMSVYFKVPIQGWTSGARTAASANLNAPVVFRAFKNGGSVTADTVIPTWTTVQKDSVSGFNSSTGIYTIKVPGDYSLSAVFDSTQTTTGTRLDVYKNNTLYAQGIAGEEGTGGGGISTILPDLKVGDTVDLRCSANRTIASSDTATHWSLAKIETSGRVYSTRVAYLRDEKASGTDGGGITSGSYVTRTLNTLTGDTSFVSLASNQFTLQPGTYRIMAVSPTFGTSRNKAKLRNITDSTDTIIGTNEYSENAASANLSQSIVEGTFSISSSKTFEIQHRSQSSKSTNGLGIAASFGDNEVYTTVKIEKVL